eukprot:3395103-Amphidinium_carterae.1
MGMTSPSHEGPLELDFKHSSFAHHPSTRQLYQPSGWYEQLTRWGEKPSDCIENVIMTAVCHAPCYCPSASQFAIDSRLF